MILWRQLVWFDTWSLFFGVSIFAEERGKLFVCWNRIRGGLILFGTITKCFSLLYILFQVESKLWIMELLFFHLSQAVYLPVLHAYGRLLFRHFKYEMQSMTEGQLKRLNCLSKITVLVVLLMLIPGKATHLNTIPTDKTQDTSIFVSIALWIQWVMVLIQVDHQSHALILYFLFLLSCYYTCMNNMKRIAEKSVLDSSTSQSIAVKCARMKRSVNHANILATLPFFLNLPSILIATPGIISLMSNRSFFCFSTVTCFAEITVIAFRAVIVISLVVLVSVLKRKLQSKQDQVIDHIHLQIRSVNSDVHWKITLDKLSNARLFDFSILSVFRLDIGLLVSFTTATITFSTLFLQIENSFKV